MGSSTSRRVEPPQISIKGPKWASTEEPAAMTDLNKIDICADLIPFLRVILKFPEVASDDIVEREVYDYLQSFEVLFPELAMGTVLV